MDDLIPYYADGQATLYHGDVIEVLRKMPGESVHCVVTSPPYWGIRDYGTGEWHGGDADCAHRRGNRKGGARRVDGGTPGNTNHAEEPYPDVCGRCGAERIDRQLGLEPSPAAYVAKMVEVFREVRRVLRSDGTVWLNLGARIGPRGRAHRLYVAELAFADHPVAPAVVLDPFGGSGTVAKVARQLGRAAWHIDLSAEYLEMAIRRLHPRKGTPMPTDMTRYPANWATEIRPAILERANHRCERCQVPNGAIGHRNHRSEFAACATCLSGGACEDPRPVRIVLTIAHVDNPDPMDCRPANLQALCQLCHNRLDGPMRQVHAAETRKRRRVQAGQGHLL